MKSILISLGIICAVAWTANAIICQKCQKANGDTCEGESVDFPYATQCMVVSEMYQVLNETYRSVKKDFNPGFPCRQVYSSNFNNACVRVNIDCCTEDNCNTANYNMPLEDIEHKGKICPSCLAAGLGECISDKTEQCIHADDKCGVYIGKLKDPGNNVREFTFHGCFSPLICEYKFDALVGTEELRISILNASKADKCTLKLL